jgi:hypothetical protein
MSKKYLPPAGQEKCFFLTSPFIEPARGYSPTWFCCYFGRTEQAAEKGLISGDLPQKHTSVAKATADSIVFMPGMNPRPPARMSFSAACEVEPCNKTCNRNVIRFSTQTRAQMAESTDTKPAIELLLIRLQIDNRFENGFGLGEDGVL